MQDAIKKIFRLMIGYFLYGLGIALTVNANLGLSPWSVFDQGLSKQFGFTLGVAVQVVGGAILIFDLLLNERVGWGTLGNIYFIGYFLDLIQQSNLIPVYDALLPRFLMMIIGMFFISLATFLYLSAQLGTGPRDGLMVALTKRMKQPVGVIRTVIEIAALTIGYFLGGTVGWGTLIMSLGSGFFIQTVFTIFKFDVRQVVHRYIDEDIKVFKNKIKESRKAE